MSKIYKTIRNEVKNMLELYGDIKFTKFQILSLCFHFLLHYKAVKDNQILREQIITEERTRSIIESVIKATGQEPIIFTNKEVIDSVRCP